jgi:hypothetical protein
MSGIGSGLTQDDGAFVLGRIDKLEEKDSPGLWHDVKSAIGEFFGMSAAEVLTQGEVKPCIYYPTSIPEHQLNKWTPEVRDAIERMPDGPAKDAARDAFENGRVVDAIFRWPPEQP